MKQIDNLWLMEFIRLNSSTYVKFATEKELISLDEYIRVYSKKGVGTIVEMRDRKVIISLSKLNQILKESKSYAKVATKVYEELFLKSKYESIEILRESEEDELYEFKEAKEQGADGHGFEVHNSDVSIIEFKSFDTRIDNYSDEVIDDFWSYSYEEYFKDYFKELDKNERISINHYKGKRFFVNFAIYSSEIDYLNFNENREWQDERVYLYYIYRDEVLAKKCIETIQAEKLNLEVSGYIFNELQIGSFNEHESWFYNDDIFDLKKIEKEYDKREFAYELLDYINWESISEENLKDEVKKAYERFFSNSITSTFQSENSFKWSRAVEKYIEDSILKIQFEDTPLSKSNPLIEIGKNQSPKYPEDVFISYMSDRELSIVYGDTTKKISLTKAGNFKFKGRIIKKPKEYNSTYEIKPHHYKRLFNSVISKTIPIDFVYDKKDSISNYYYLDKITNEKYHIQIYTPRETKSLKKSFKDALKAFIKRRRESFIDKNFNESAKRVFVSIKNSLNSGNCKYGTMLWCRDNQIDTLKIGALRGDLIMSIEDSSFTRRAIKEAILKREEKIIEREYFK